MTRIIRTGRRTGPRERTRDIDLRTTHPAHPAEDHLRLRSARGDAIVELVDHRVPHPDIAAQTPPERLMATLLEQLERGALLLHPGVVAEVENPPPIGLGAIDHVLRRRVSEMLTEHL